MTGFFQAGAGSALPHPGRFANRPYGDDSCRWNPTRRSDAGRRGDRWGQTSVLEICLRIIGGRCLARGRWNREFVPEYVFLPVTNWETERLRTFDVPATTSSLSIGYREGVGLLFEHEQDLKRRHQITPLNLPET